MPTPRKSDLIRADLAKMADFMDGRTNGEIPRPNLRVTKARHAEIVRNPSACGCRMGEDRNLYFRTYKLEPF